MVRVWGDVVAKCKNVSAFCGGHAARPTRMGAVRRNGLWVHVGNAMTR